MHFISHHHNASFDHKNVTFVGDDLLKNHLQCQSMNHEKVEISFVCGANLLEFHKLCIATMLSTSSLEIAKHKKKTRKQLKQLTKWEILFGHNFLVIQRRSTITVKSKTIRNDFLVFPHTVPVSDDFSIPSSSYTNMWPSNSKLAFSIIYKDSLWNGHRYLQSPIKLYVRCVPFDSRTNKQDTKQIGINGTKNENVPACPSVFIQATRMRAQTTKHSPETHLIQIEFLSHFLFRPQIASHQRSFSLT